MQNKRYKLRCKIKRGEAQVKDASHFKNLVAELSRQSIHHEKIYSSKKERNLVNKQKYRQIHKEYLREYNRAYFQRRSQQNQAKVAPCFVKLLNHFLKFELIE